MKAGTIIRDRLLGLQYTREHSYTRSLLNAYMDTLVGHLSPSLDALVPPPSLHFHCELV